MPQDAAETPQIAKTAAAAAVTNGGQGGLSGSERTAAVGALTAQQGEAQAARANLVADTLAFMPAAGKGHNVNLKGAARSLTDAHADLLPVSTAKAQTGNGLAKAIGSIASSAASNGDGEEHKTILESCVDKVLSVGIKDEKTRNTLDKYGTEILTTGALFAGGKVGMAATVVLYGLNSASLDEKPLDMAEDISLGMVRGGLTRAIFAGASKLPTAPLKGVVTGIGTRSLADIVNRDSFSDPSKTLAKLHRDTFNGGAMTADAVTWTLGEGIFHGSNYLSGGRLGANPLVKGITMGASFGAVNGSNAEIAREKAAKEDLNVGKIVKQGLIEAAIGGASAAGGMRATSAWGGDPAVHINEVKGKGRLENQALPLKLTDKEAGVTISAGTLASIASGSKVIGIKDIPGLDRKKAASTQIPSDIFGETPGDVRPEAPPDPEVTHEKATTGTPKDPPPTNPKSASREYVIDSSRHEFASFRNRQSTGTFLNVREVLKNEKGKQEFGPKQILYVQKLGTGGEKTLDDAAAKADIVVTSHPEVLSDADRAKHIFPDGEGKVWLAMSGNGRKGSTLRLATGDVQLSQWRKEGFVDPIRLDNGNVSLSVMAPLLVGDPHDVNGEKSKGDWAELDRQLAEAKRLGIDAVSTDVWWGLIEPEKGKFDFSYYEKLSDHIKQAGLKWVPILSFHQCGGNVGDTAYVPLPDWVWSDVAARASNGDVEAVKYKSEQGHTSPEYLSLFADHAAMENYTSVMKAFQNHFTAKAGDIAEVNISLGPAGELRYPAYNSHDQNTGYPNRGALQSYSPLAIAAFKDYALKKYGDHSGVGKAWGIDNLDDNHILPPSDAGAFFGRGDHFNTQYGRDFIDWYNQSLIEHGRTMLSSAVDVFGQKQSAFYGIDIGAKLPGVHWRVGVRQGNNVQLGDRLAEVPSGLIATSRGDWDRDEDGRGYRPLLSMVAGLQPKVAGVGNRVVPYFTCLEMPDGDGGPSVKALPHSLATWVGQEAERQGLWLKGENALNGNLYNPNSWDLMRGFLTLPNQHGLYHGLTFLRINDIVDNQTARDRVSQINTARGTLELIRQSIRRIFDKAA